MSDDIPLGRYTSGSAYPSDKKYADGEFLDSNNSKGNVCGLYTTALGHGSHY